MISRIILQNFKRYKRVDFICNSDINIFVGENGAGKSTLLYAIGLVLSGSHSLIERSSLANIFNQEAILEFMSTKDIKQLPEVIIEIFFDEINTEISSNFTIIKFRKSPSTGHTNLLTWLKLPNCTMFLLAIFLLMSMMNIWPRHSLVLAP